jgi:hypothetical protein
MILYYLQLLLVVHHESWGAIRRCNDARPSPSVHCTPPQVIQSTSSSSLVPQIFYRNLNVNLALQSLESRTSVDQGGVLTVKHCDYDVAGARPAGTLEVSRKWSGNESEWH